MTIFGTIRSDDEVEMAVVESLQKWLPTYMSEVEHQRGLEAPYYARPPEGSYTVRSDFETWPEEMLPLVIVVAPGIDDDPEKEARGKHRGVFNIAVTCVVESIDQIETRNYAHRMGAAIRASLVQHWDLDGALDCSVRGVDWIGTRNDELPSEASRTIWGCRQLFQVQVGDILTRMAGPSSPIPPIALDPVTIPDIDHIHVSVEKEPINS